MNMIILFAKDKARCEIRCSNSDADMHIKVQQAAGWNLIRVIGVDRKWQEEHEEIMAVSFKRMMCIHGSVCTQVCTMECDDFER